MSSNLETFLQERKHARAERLNNFFHRSPDKSSIVAQLRINHQQRVSQRAELRYFSNNCKTKRRLALDLQYPDESFCKIQWKTAESLQLVHVEQEILSIFETVHAVRLAHAVNLRDDAETILNIYEEDLKTFAVSLNHNDYSAEEQYGTQTIETQMDPAPVLKPRSQALSLVSCSDSGYDSDEWEYVEEDEASEGEDWEYFVDISSLEIPRKELQGPNCREPVPWKRGAKEETISSSLNNWIKTMRDFQSEILICLENEFNASQFCGDLATSERTFLKPSVKQYIGKEDKQGRYHGKGQLKYNNGTIVWGKFSHGVLEGPATIEHLNGERQEGTFVSDRLEGWVTEKYGVTGWRQTFYRRGLQVGYFRDVSPCGNIIEFGVVGSVAWRLTEGGSMVISKKGPDGKYQDNEAVYLYPGFELGISVSYERGRMVRGREATPAYIKPDRFGLPRVVMTNVGNSRLLEFENPGTHIPAKNCNMRDLWDMIHVYVAPSHVEFAGEGLFARRNICNGSLVCLFSGAKKRHFRNDQDHFQFSDYMIKVDESCSIDIPDFYIPTEHYSATLGHKACHSFANNAAFYQLYHPRFGKIMAIFAKRDLAEGEEIYVSYNYNVATAPEWYQQSWLSYLSQNRGWSKDDIRESGLRAASSANLYNKIEEKTKRMDKASSNC